MKRRRSEGHQGGTHLYLGSITAAMPAARGRRRGDGWAAVIGLLIALLTLGATLIGSADARVWAVNAARRIPIVGPRVAHGSGYVPVPDCVGLTEGEAREAITGHSLVPVILESDESTGACRLIRDQEPSPRLLVPKGTLVRIWVDEALSSTLSEDERVVWSVVDADRALGPVCFLSREEPVEQVRMHTRFTNRSSETVVLPPLVRGGYVVGAGGRGGAWAATYSSGAQVPPLLTGGEGWRLPEEPISLAPGESKDVFVRIARRPGAWLEVRLDLGVPAGSFVLPVRFPVPGP